ncbi:MAG: hypothetical protein ACOC3X_00355 [Nanoarchaeota archaeon]
MRIKKLNLIVGFLLLLTIVLKYFGLLSNIGISSLYVDYLFFGAAIYLILRGIF